MILSRLLYDFRQKSLTKINPLGVSGHGTSSPYHL